MSNKQLYIGLISGTSVDGIDCVLVHFNGAMPELLATHSHPIPDSLRASVLELCKGESGSLRQLGTVSRQLGVLFADAANAVLAESGHKTQDVAAIGSHGQTVWHEPEGEHPFTLQIGDPNTIAQGTGITTIADLRGRDLAAGGQGAPLAPLLHRNVFHSPDVDRAIVNIGGFGNITALPRTGNCLAFDTGPGNVLMDYWIEKNRQQNFDRNGEWAATGQFSLELLNLLLAEEYFNRPPPKSTGRELFNGKWLEARLALLNKALSAEDVQATLVTFTASTIVSDLARYAAAQEVYVCGGGAHNGRLMDEISKLASDISVHSTEKLGMNPDWVEATAFAWMAQQTLAGKPIDTGDFTGARTPVILGGIYQA
jgi:anhydro-N-acetylmuramic acid kinase